MFNFGGGRNPFGWGGMQQQPQTSTPRWQPSQNFGQFNPNNLAGDIMGGLAKFRQNPGQFGMGGLMGLGAQAAGSFLQPHAPPAQPQQPPTNGFAAQPAPPPPHPFAGMSSAQPQQPSPMPQASNSFTAGQIAPQQQKPQPQPQPPTLPKPPASPWGNLGFSS